MKAKEAILLRPWTLYILYPVSLLHYYINYFIFYKTCTVLPYSLVILQKKPKLSNDVIVSTSAGSLQLNGSVATLHKWR